MTNQRNETPEPLAGATVEACISALAEALRREKGWLFDYGHSVVRDAIDRKHLEPLALPAHPEPHSHTWTEQEKRCILAWGAELVARKAEPLAQGQTGEMPEIAAIRAALAAGPTPGPWHSYTLGGQSPADFALGGHLIELPKVYQDRSVALRPEDARYIASANPVAVAAILAALQAKDAEIARLKADAGPVTAVLAVDVGGRPGVHGQTIGADGAGQFAYIIRGTQEQADKWACEHIRQREKSGQQFFSCLLVFNEEGYGGPMLTEIDAAIRAQTGGDSA